MSVQRKPKSHTNDIKSTDADKFIAGANKNTPKKAKKVPVALRLNTELLAAIDAMADRRGTSRNAIISYWCSKGIENEKE